MRLSFNKYPVDIILCILSSITLLPIALLEIEGTIQMILGLPFILFIPGYTLIFALFPSRKTDKGIDVIERITLSFGLSIAIVSLLGLLLNYTPWGIRLESVLLSIFVLIITMGIIAIYKWKKTNPDERFIISLDIFLPKTQNKLESLVTIILALSIIIAVILPVYVLITPKARERFTEFYLLDSDHKTQEYQRNLAMGANVTGIIGIENHEYITFNYTIEIWLINQSYYYNKSENSEKTIIHNMWFVDKITTALKHTDVIIGKSWLPQWEYNYSYTINRIGSFKLVFLLFSTSTGEYISQEDYKGIAEQKIDGAYRETHLWLDVFYVTPPNANFTFSPDTPTSKDIIYFTSTSTSPDSRIVMWKWDYGDGNTSYGETIGLEFDGINDYVECGNDANLQPVNGTVEAWIYLKEFIGTKIIFTSSGSYVRRHPNFRVEDNALIIALTNNTHRELHSHKANLKRDIWYHVAITWNGSSVRFYVNGSLKETQSQNLIPRGNTRPKRIGALNPPDFPEFFNGTMNNIKIYNRPLNSTEIQNNYGGNVTTKGLVSWWKMNEKRNVTHDYIGDNDGIIYGANWVNQALHNYIHPGTYKVRLTILNEDGLRHSISKNITIS